MRLAANATSSTPSLITAEAQPRELHRWIPYLPPPTTPTPSSVSPTPSPRHTVSEHSFHAEALSPSPSGPSTRSPSPYSLPISELDVVPTSHVPLTLLPPAVITQDIISDVSSRPHYDEDPFADPGPSYVRGAETVTTYTSSHADGDTVTVPRPAASARSSGDWMSITTSSTLPPSYRTHRPTVRSVSGPYLRPTGLTSLLLPVSNGARRLVLRPRKTTRDGGGADSNGRTWTDLLPGAARPPLEALSAKVHGRRCAA